MKEGWKTKLLKDVCEVFVDGDWVESKDQSNEGIRLIQTGNIGFGIFKDKEDKSRFISEDTFKRLKCTEVLPGDLLVSRLPDPVGKSCIIPDINSKMITGVDCTVIRPKEFISSEFLCYYQQSSEYLNDVNIRITGTTRSRISRKNLGDISIPIPPLNEQQQIVSILDEAFAAIDQAKANIEKNIANAKELFQSKLNQIFSQKGEGWEEKELVSFCEVKDGTHDSPKYVDESIGIPFVTQKNIIEQGFSMDDVKFISEEDHQTFYRRSNAAFGDILFSMIGANRGMAAVVDKDVVFSIKNVGLIKANDNYDTVYLLYYLKSPLAQKYVLENSSGSAQGFIGLGKLRKFPIPYAPLNEQKRISSEINELKYDLDDLILKYSIKLTSLENLKKSILQKAFSGELTSKKLDVA